MWNLNETKTHGEKKVRFPVTRDKGMGGWGKLDEDS